MENSTQRYTIKSLLGAGGFGSVYLAYDAKLQRDVAIKRIDKGDCKEEVRTKLMDEARVLAALKHPNIVSIYDVSSHLDFDEIVMEYINGITLQTFVKRHLLQPNDFRHIGAQILHAMSASHKAGVLHCDIKPENVMLSLSSGDQYELKIFDFGISKPSESTSKDDNFKLIGSVYVMAPELFNQQHPTEKSDIYALGCLFYFLLTGAYPYNGKGTIQIMAAHIKGKHRPLLAIRPDLGQDFCQWVEKFIHSEPQDRWENCASALEELLRFNFADKLGVFTLPTDLNIPSSNSRVVRTLTRRSLEYDPDVPDGRITRFLTNTITHGLGVSKSAQKILDEAEFTDLPTQRLEALPDTAEWFFTISETAKGPVTLDQLFRLVENDKIEAGTMVWHPHYGEWVHAYTCNELKPYFPNAPELSPSEQESGSPNQASPELDSPISSPLWRSPEIITILVGAILCSAVYFFNPALLKNLLVGYAALNTVIGFILLRTKQLRQGARWFISGLLLPILADLLFVIVKKDCRAAISLAMFTIGSLYLLISLTAILAENSLLFSPL